MRRTLIGLLALLPLAFLLQSCGGDTETDKPGDVTVYTTATVLNRVDNRIGIFVFAEKNDTDRPDRQGAIDEPATGRLVFCGIATSDSVFDISLPPGNYDFVVAGGRDGDKTFTAEEGTRIRVTGGSCKKIQVGIDPGFNSARYANLKPSEVPLVLIEE